MQPMSRFDAEAVRADFPILGRKVHGKPMIYLDNAATTQTPRVVLDSIVRHYFTDKANVHRGVHCLSQEATAAMEAARERARAFTGAPSAEQIIFTRGTTEAINLVASSVCRLFEPGDRIVLTAMEHHSNIVPWQIAARRNGLEIDVVPILPDGALDMAEYRRLLGGRTRLVAAAHVSNVLGTVNPVAEMAAMAHEHNAIMLVDGAQAVAHLKVDVQAIGADFYAFSSHKMYGPNGIGILYGRRDLLEAMPPYQGGGEMIGHVSFAGTTWADLPYKFEAGTPDFVDAAAFSAAVDFLESKDIAAVAAHEHQLTAYATEEMMKIDGMRIFGTAPGKAAVISFLLGNAHHYDTGVLLDQLGVEVRTGHHCAQPLMETFGIEGTVRLSFAMYNTFAEVDAFLAALRRIAPML